MARVWTKNLADKQRPNNFITIEATLIRLAAHPIRFLALFFLLSAGWISLSEQAQAQSSNVISQGFYYRAKELHEADRNSEALPYIARSKQTLGGTNVQLQYLHIMILVGTKDYVKANTELQRFFAITDKLEAAVAFQDGVDRLTHEEQRQLTRVMVDIMEKAESQKTQIDAEQARIERERILATKEDAVIGPLDEIISIARTFGGTSADGRSAFSNSISRTNRTTITARNVQKYTQTNGLTITTEFDTKFTLRDICNVYVNSGNTSIHFDLPSGFIYETKSTHRRDGSFAWGEARAIARYIYHGFAIVRATPLAAGPEADRLKDAVQRFNKSNQELRRALGKNSC